MRGLSMGVGLNRGLGFAPGSLFSAAEVGVWYDPSDTGSVFQDDAGTVPGAVDAVVGRINDKSGNGKHATQATLGNKPILRLADGLYYLEFDGTDDFLATASIDLTAIDASTVWAGARKTSDAAQKVVMELSADASNNLGTFGLHAPSGASASYRFQHKGGANSLAIATGAQYAAPHSAVLTGIGDISSDTCILRINGIEAATSATDQVTQNFGNYPVYIGMRGGLTLPFAGRLYGLIILGRTATAGELSNTEAWLAGRSGT